MIWFKVLCLLFGCIYLAAIVGEIKDGEKELHRIIVYLIFLAVFVCVAIKIPNITWDEWVEQHVEQSEVRDKIKKGR